MAVEPDASAEAETLAALAPGARRASRTVRIRLGIGAAAVLGIAALVVTVVISLLAPSGGSRTVDAATAVTAQSGRSTSSTPEAGSTAAAGAATAADGPGRAAPGTLFVHVLGAVNRAGLYQLSTGARVVDAIAAAGGFTDEANQGGVNLARALTDGEQLVVPKIGEPVTDGAIGAGGVGGAAGSGSAGSGSAGAGSGGKVNLNTAGQAELETLPQVGPATAARILKWRADNGRFTTVDDLMDVSGIGPKTFDALKDLVTV